jgi:hypothetical protein
MMRLIAGAATASRECCEVSIIQRLRLSEQVPGGYCSTFGSAARYFTPGGLIRLGVWRAGSGAHSSVR